MGLTRVGQNCHFNGVYNNLGIKGIYLQMIKFLLWWYEQDLYFVNSTHHNAYKNLLFKVIHWYRRTVCSKIPHTVQSYPKCWGNFGQQYFSFYLYQILCHTILIWKISQYIIGPMICYHLYLATYYMWDTVNMQTQKASKVPPFDGTHLCHDFNWYLAKLPLKLQFQC